MSATMEKAKELLHVGRPTQQTGATFTEDRSAHGVKDVTKPGAHLLRMVFYPAALPCYGVRMLNMATTHTLTLTILCY
jgi:hypothetical protein